MINKILTTKTKSNNSAIFFDLDSTLYDVSPRSKKILLEISQDPIFKNKFPEQCNKLERAEVHATDWGIEEALSRLEITGTVDFFKSITLLWRQKFFSNEYLKHDVPYEGAVDFVKE